MQIGDRRNALHFGDLPRSKMRHGPPNCARPGKYLQARPDHAAAGKWQTHTAFRPNYFSPDLFFVASDTARVEKSPAMAPMITTRLRFRNLAIRPNLREADA
jgi:hypothetical protein